MPAQVWEFLGQRSFAHIDAVSLGGLPPVDVGEADPILALKKLSKRDFDVLDGYQKSLEIKFTGIKKDKILKITRSGRTGCST